MKNNDSKNKSCLKYLEEKNIQTILKNVPNLNGIEDILGKDKNGELNKGSALFYLLPHIYGRLLENDPDKVLSKKSIEFRKKYLYNSIRAIAKFDLHGKELIIEKNSELPTDKPIIFASNHGFLEDATSTFIVSGAPAYYVFGSLPQFFNSTYGVSAYLIGSILVNRKNRDSRRASIDKAVKALELGGNVIIFPEGTYNRTPEKLLLPFWSGVFRIAKKANAVVVPLVHLPVDDKIYSSRLPYVDFSNYTLEQEGEALEELRNIMATELYDLMEKHSHTTREELLGDFATMDQVVEDRIAKQVGGVGKYYDFEAERDACFTPKSDIDSEEVWDPIIKASKVNKDQNKIKKLIKTNYAKKF